MRKQKAIRKRVERTPARLFKHRGIKRVAAEMGYNYSYLWKILENKPGFPGRPGLREEVLSRLDKPAALKGGGE